MGLTFTFTFSLTHTFHDKRLLKCITLIFYYIPAMFSASLSFDGCIKPVN